MITAASALTGLMSASLIFSLTGKDPGRSEAVSRAGTSPPDTQVAKPNAAKRAQVNEAYGKLPLMFEANTGQADSQVKFISRGSGYRLFLTSTEAVLTLSKPTKYKGRKDSLATSQIEDAQIIEPPAVLRMKLEGANPASQVEGLDKVLSKSNYFIGNEPEKWRTNVPNYAKVKYESVYPGVDLVYYGNQGQLEHDFVVAPGVNPKIIAMRFEGERRHKIAANGDLVLSIKGGEVRLQRPRIYQEVGGVQREVAGGYVLRDKRQVGFEVATYDTTRPLVIDPVVVYSTYLGGGGSDAGFGIAVDTSGNAYFAGFADSADFPTTTGSFDTTYNGSFDAFVTKLDPTGSAVVYSTYLGGSDETETGRGIAIDTLGNAYVIGLTASPNFPTTGGAFDTTYNGSYDAFVTKLDPTGSALVYSTYLGDGGDDRGERIAVDNSGNAYVTGATASMNFPTPLGAFDTTFNGGDFDPFVTKLNQTGSALVYSTYLGGSLTDAGEGVAVDTLGNAYVTGSTRSGDFPTTLGAFDTTFNGASDAFVTMLNPAGAALVYSTYLGSSCCTDGGEGIAVDGDGNAYVTGRAAPGFPTTAGAFSTTPNGAHDAFVTKLNQAGALVYSTYLGGSNFEEGIGIAVDGAGYAYVTGQTFSANFPTTGCAFDTTFNGFIDFFVTKLNPTGSALVYSTYLGGAIADVGLGIAVDTLGDAYVTGVTNSPNFPTTAGALDTTLGGTDDAFVTKISPGISPATPPVAKCKNIQVSANSSCQASITAADVDDGSFDPDACDSIASRTLDTSGPFGLGPHTVTLTVTDTQGASSSGTAMVNVVDTTPPIISCQQNITVEPTSSAGAAVSFNSTATDNCDSSLNVSCSRVSGSTFSIGTTTVNCTATDDHPNSSGCSFTVTVLTPKQVADELISSVNDLIATGVLTQNQGQGLLDKLQAIKDALNKGKTATACNQLKAFINQVNGLVGSGNLTAAQAQPLIDSATNMKKTLGCP